MQVYPNLQWLHDYLHAATFYSDPLRLIGYTLLVWLGRLTDLCSGAITALLGINVMNIGPVKALAETISPVGWSILTVALTASGILMMFYSGKQGTAAQSVPGGRSHRRGTFHVFGTERPEGRRRQRHDRDAHRQHLDGAANHPERRCGRFQFDFRIADATFRC